jgi:pSer/pThr/pTyr-binding forkhead associated (FHA) protein
MSPTRVILEVKDDTFPEKELIFTNHAHCVLGRAEDCDIRFPRDELHRDVSRHHCELDVDPPTIRVRDLGSRNGTYVNGRKIGQQDDTEQPEAARASAAAAAELHAGDELRVGGTIFRVAIDDPDLVGNSDFVPRPWPWL